ncbi:MAG: DUF2125 domain-containing protein [Xanthobacteraceae bacterium]
MTEFRRENMGAVLGPTQPRRKRRPWLLAIPLAVFFLIAAGWSAFWFVAASRANTAIAEWRDREAQAGRSFTCATQSIGGFPFRLEVACGEPNFELKNLSPEVILAARAATVVAQVYDPTLLIGEFTGPMLIGEPGKPADMSASWTLAKTSVRGTPGAPERASIVVDNPEISRAARATMEPFAAAKHLEVHGRVLPQAAGDKASIEVVLRLSGGTAPMVHPAMAQPTDAEIGVVVSGLNGITPKPLAVHLRELAAAHGQIDIRQARISQGEILAVGSGALTVTPEGLLDGRVTMTIAGLDKLITLLGLDDMLTQYLAPRGGGLTMDKIASGLDRILPGLGGAVRNNQGGIAAAGITLLGEPRDLEGRKATAVPLRFSEGMVYLGPLQIGRMSPLF